MSFSPSILPLSFYLNFLFYFPPSSLSLSLNNSKMTRVSLSGEVVVTRHSLPQPGAIRGRLSLPHHGLHSFPPVPPNAGVGPCKDVLEKPHLVPASFPADFNSICVPDTFDFLE